jgi:hypothetical protein
MIRENEEALMKLFQKVTVRDKSGKEHQVKTIYASEEKSTSLLPRELVAEDIEKGVDKINLPMISFSLQSIDRWRMSFKGRIHTMWRQDLNEIIEKLFQIEKEMEDRTAGERKLILGTFVLDEGKADKQINVLRADFNFYFE